jgi:hypothetical protein
MVTIALTCCILHNFCQFQGMLEPMVHDIQTHTREFDDGFY